MCLDFVVPTDIAHSALQGVWFWKSYLSADILFEIVKPIGEGGGVWDVILATCGDSASGITKMQ